MDRSRFAQAVRALSGSQYEDCVRLCEALLDEYGPHLDTAMVQAIALCESGQMEAGSACFDALQSAHPDHADLLYNRASVTARCGDHEQAVTWFRRTLIVDPDHHSARNNLASSLLELDQHEAAASCYEQLLARQPGHVGALFNLGNLALMNDHPEQASARFSEALRRQPDHTASLIGLASLANAEGRYQDALERLSRVPVTEQRRASFYRERSSACTGAGSFPQALSDAQRAVEIEPGSADLTNNLGVCESGQGHLEAAEQAFRAAMTLDPGHVQALANLIDLYELSNRMDDGQSLLLEHADLIETQPSLQLAQARYLQRGNQPEAALAACRTLMADGQADRLRRDASFIAGRAHDVLRQSQAAIDAWTLGNDLVASMYQRDQLGEETLVSILPALARHWLQPMSAKADSIERPPVFLFGFQRSGTTLLDTMLGSDSEIQVMEELPVLNRIVDHLQRQPDFPANLYQLQTEELNQLRDEYLTSASSCLLEATGESLDRSKLLIDKSPLNGIFAPLIQALFPEARLIMALRHPCDVVLSCFMQEFTMTPFMLNYTSLKGVTSVYEQVMGLWLNYLPVHSLAVHTIRYEDLVTNKDSSLRALMAHIGHRAEAVLGDHTDHATRRGLINTPSYHQVSQPVYTSARYRWRRYEAQLVEVMPILEPFIQAFGYAEGDEG